MSSLQDLMSLLTSEVAAVSEAPPVEGADEDLFNVFHESVEDTMREIRGGADSDSFSELVVINFIISASQSGYSASEIRAFVSQLKPYARA